MLPGTTGSSSLIAQLSARLTPPSKQQQLHNERFNEAKMYAQTLQQGQGPPQQGMGVYEAAAAALGRQPNNSTGGAESIYGKKSDYFAPPTSSRQPVAGPSSSSASTLSSSQLPPPPQPPISHNKQSNQNQSQQAPIKESRNQSQQSQNNNNNNKIYYAPQQLVSPPGGTRYQSAPQPIPSALAGPSSHYSINQKIYMSPTNPFLSSAMSPPQVSQGIYGVTTGERQLQPPRHPPPAVPQRSYLQQYHAQNLNQGESNQSGHQSMSSSPQQSQHHGQSIVPPQYHLYQRPQQPQGTKFVSSPIYNSVAPGGDRGAGGQMNVAYHAGQASTSPLSSSTLSSNTAQHPSK